MVTVIFLDNATSMNKRKRPKDYVGGAFGSVLRQVDEVTARVGGFDGIQTIVAVA